MVHVPRVDFTSLNFANFYSDHGNNPNNNNEYLVYSGFTSAVKTMVSATCMLGTILPFTAPAANSTWSINFHGPSLECFPVDAQLQSAIRDNIWTAFRMQCTDWELIKAVLCRKGTYLSWTPGATQLPYTLPSDLRTIRYPDSSTPASHDCPNNIMTTGGSLGPLSGKSTLTDDISMPATIYFAITPSNGMDNLTVIQCGLRNSSYDVLFNFLNGIQDVKLNVSHTYNDVFAFKSLNVTKTNGILNTTLTERLAYQSIMDAFGTMFIGLKYVTINSGSLMRDPYMIPNSSIMSTVLGMRAKELQSLRSHDLNPFSEWNGTSITNDIDDQFGLQNGIEELFKNITVNLMTAYWLQ